MCSIPKQMLHWHCAAFYSSAKIIVFCNNTAWGKTQAIQMMECILYILPPFSLSLANSNDHISYIPLGILRLHFNIQYYCFVTGRTTGLELIN